MSDTSAPPPCLHNRYLLVRHGHSEANQQGIVVGDPERGIEAFGLSENGKRQLEVLTRDWAWARPTRIVHSDFLRTTQTAQILAARFGLEPEADPRLRERFFGELEGETHARYAAVWEEDARNPEHARWGVEPVRRVAARMQKVIDDLEAAARDETIVLVSHGDPLQILLTALEGRPLTEHRKRTGLEPASVTPIGKKEVEAMPPPAE